MIATLQEACYENTTAVYMALELSNKQWKVLIGDVVTTTAIRRW